MGHVTRPRTTRTDYRTRYHLTAIAFATLAVSATAAEGQPACQRCLNGFRFIPSSVIADPFAATSFNNAIGGGSAVNFTVPIRRLNGDTLRSIEGDIGFLLVDIEYQKSITNWLALRASAGGIGRLGTSIPSLVATGVSAAFGAALGATVPVFRRPNLLVSAAADFRSNTQYDVDPFGFGEEVADSAYDPESDSGALLRSYPVDRWSLGVRAAWGIAPWVGLSAKFEPGGARVNSDNKSLTTYGALVGFDFAKRNDVPIGLTLGYRGESGSGKTGNIAGGYQTVQVGAYYTGGSNFQIGSDFFFSRIAVASGGPDLDGIQFRLVTRIDF